MNLVEAHQHTLDSAAADYAIANLIRNFKMVAEWGSFLEVKCLDFLSTNFQMS